MNAIYLVEKINFFLNIQLGIFVNLASKTKNDIKLLFGTFSFISYGNIFLCCFL